MRKDLEISTPDSCLNRARRFEWVFVLLGRDKAAPATIRFWIAERLRLKLNSYEDAQLSEARAAANAIEVEQSASHLVCPSCGEVHAVNTFLCRLSMNLDLRLTSGGILSIMAERDRQITCEGFDEKHDLVHRDGELAGAAIAYLLSAGGHMEQAYMFWPWNQDSFKARNRMDDLVRAGALVAAEIDRLDALERAEGKTDEV